MIGLTYLTYVISTSAVRRNNSVKEPEACLWGALVPLILHPAGCILYSISTAYQMHWIWLVILFIVMGAILALSYTVDCYKEIPGSISLVFSETELNYYAQGFAFGYAVTPMVTTLGLQNTFYLVAFLGMGLTDLCFVMIWFGKSTRKGTAKWYWALVEQDGFRAH
ncbi:unnamed protein product [Clonostachys rosea f. rosea IK726]|uniref:Uncharacterized protein n=1 Tax=Clonostachys rosea f. rosea IK726 TaxID=1349383 RepID=A0ACA9UMB8_BIOOC|nr:unnamed protein product [Clonostachys rosea f. rosea IK726]